MELMDHQRRAIDQLSNGKILWGGVGSGKSATVMHYYIEKEAPRNVYVITTAKKRDSLDWEKEAMRVAVGTSRDTTTAGVLNVDSWNNIGKYVDIEDAFFIFDEQRVVGYGSWVKAFLKIAKKNHWLLLSATPGDTWLDYAPVFIANNLYKNITQFKVEHVMYAPFSRFPRVVRYLDIPTLEKYRNMILVEMPYISPAERHIKWQEVNYDHELFRKVVVDRWNPFEKRPVKDVSDLFRIMRKLVNTDASRLTAVTSLLQETSRLVVFYNFDYELEILRSLGQLGVQVAEWNGHRHELIPNADKWVYLVQYQSGAEGWNCTETNAMCFYSLTYSYKNFIQAQGRIDRMDTPFKDLYYYVLWSNSIIDRAIRSVLGNKKSFNELEWYKENWN